MAERGIAQVTFRVRCENAGHGEAVFLSQTTGDTSDSAGNKIPLFTTAKSYPWYTTRTVVPLTLPAGDGSGDVVYRYRYAIYRAGIFHRWENVSDAVDIKGFRHGDQGTNVHELPLRLFQAGELYTVNDVLGVTGGPPDVDHIKVRQQFSSVGSLARKNSSAGSLGLNAGRPGGSSGALSDAGGSKKKVGFNIQPSASVSHSRGGAPAKQAVHLTSSDGLIVVSAFLPVHVTRSDNGEWSADWDYEALLSMQTHLRVTRVGTVKWRGWHGNVGGGASAESGVPLDERHKVEAALRPFNCVPVWVPTNLFGEMYNGFCKGVLWPILHNVASVYSSPTGVSSENPASEKQIEPYDLEYAEYSMDDVAQGPIHGDGGREGELWAAFTAVNRYFTDVIIQCFNGEPKS